MRISTVPHSEGQPICGSQNPVTKAKGHPVLNHSHSNGPLISDTHISQNPYLKSAMPFVER